MKPKILIHISSNGVERIQPVVDSSEGGLIAGAIVQIVKPYLDLINSALQKSTPESQKAENLEQGLPTKTGVVA